MPINIDDLWIGDQVKIISTGQVGKFHGKEGDQVKIEVEFQNVLVESNDIDLYEDPIVVQPLRFDDEMVEPNIKVASSIDLHMETLAPEMSNQLPARIRDYQLMRAKDYIMKSIAAKKSIITIIHGKGTGVLKSELGHMLKQISEVRFTFDRNKGGATEVWLR